MRLDTPIARVSLWLPPLAYMVMIFYLSSQSDPAPELTTRVWDKLLHVLAYAGLAVLFCRALLGEGLRSLTALAIAILLTSAYGASDEYHQMFVPLRSSEVQDWIGDSIGAVAGSIGYFAIRGSEVRLRRQ